ncbi:MAG TPA: hypothetical protein DD706_14375 [Nitrospiraceae bacterium]|nr:hypothetical protein [Nitrospiraceae bacterium]
MTKKRDQEACVQEIVASQEDITKAIESLSDAQLLKLRNFSKLRIRVVWRKASGKSYEDLLSEAILGTFEGERKWFKERVTFISHLLGVIRSISSHWAEKYDRNEGSVKWVNTSIDPDGREIDPIASVPSETPNSERALGAKEQIEKVTEALSKDNMALEVLNGLLEEMKGPDIKEILGLSQTEYETIRKRINRTAKKVLL